MPRATCRYCRRLDALLHVWPAGEAPGVRVAVQLHLLERLSSAGAVEQRLELIVRSAAQHLVREPADELAWARAAAQIQAGAATAAAAAAAVGTASWR